MEYNVTLGRVFPAATQTLTLNQNIYCKLMLQQKGDALLGERRRSCRDSLLFPGLPSHPNGEKRSSRFGVRLCTQQLLNVAELKIHTPVG